MKFEVIPVSEVFSEGRKLDRELDGFQYSYSEVVPCIWCRTSVAYEQEAFRDPVPFDPGPVALGWQLDFVPTAEGFYSFTENRYIYQYRDHLGNARVSYAKDGQGNLQITDTNNYYAFGMNHIGGMKSMLGGYQSYKYNGKEIQESGMYDYGARFYMPDIGRWGVVDPLAETSRRWSTYTYAFNNPIRFIDPDGMQNQDIIFGKSVSAETQNKIVGDLEKETGLKLSVGDDGKLSYQESADAGGSKTARDMLKGAIDNHRTEYQVNSDNSKGTSIDPTGSRGEVIDGVYSATVTYDLNINTDQIDKFIAGTSEALNPYHGLWNVYFT